MVFYKWYISNPFLFSETFSSPVLFVRIFFNEISLQKMVSVPGQSGLLEYKYHEVFVFVFSVICSLMREVE